MPLERHIQRQTIVQCIVHCDDVELLTKTLLDELDEYRNWEDKHAVALLGEVIELNPGIGRLKLIEVYTRFLLRAIKFKD